MNDMTKRNVYLLGLLLVVIAFGFSFPIISAYEAYCVVCSEGILKIGDTVAYVSEKCGKTARESENEWAYDDATPSFTVYFEEKKVVRILVEH